MTGSVAIYNLGLVGLAIERLFELRLSRRNANRAIRCGAVEVGQVHYYVMVLFHSLFFVACSAEATLLTRPFPGVLGVAALACALAAQGLRYWAVATLGERWSTRIIAIPGLPPVTGGPYRYLRHPNYLAVLVEMTCVPLIHGCWGTALVYTVGNGVLLTVRIRTEERALGQAYADTFASRPRFLPAWHSGSGAQ